MAVVDVYDAAATRRLYSPSKSHDETVKLIVSGRGTHFDPAVVDAFLKVAPRLRFETGLPVEDVNAISERLSATGGTSVRNSGTAGPHRADRSC